MYLEEGQIVIGYQGVGKSTLAYHNKRVVDLESSDFKIKDKNGEIDADWYISYCNAARVLARQGYIVCISSHKSVRDELKRKPANRQIIVYPSLFLKDSWIKSLRYRYENTNSEKNLRALKRAELFYEEDITDLMNQDGFEHIEITSMSYNLQNMIAEREV